MMIIDDWLEDQISERKFDFGPAADTDEFGMFAGMLRAEALASGCSLDALENACGGDISSLELDKMLPLSPEAARLMNVQALGAEHTPDRSAFGGNAHSQ